MLIERYAGPLSIDLIEPLTALGGIYNESGLYEEATQAFDRALRLNHINLGFTNFDQFPIMDGLTATCEIRKKLPNLPIYALTANAMAGDQERCMKAGMNGFLAKPINLVELKKVLQQYGNK